MPDTLVTRSRVRPPLLLLLPALAAAILMLAPIAYLVMRASEAGSDVWPLIWRERTARIAWNTVVLSAGVAAGAVAIAVPLAWLTTRTDLPRRRFWDTVAALPLVISSYAGALAVIGALGPRGFVQQALAPVGVERIPSLYGFTGAWLALTLFSYPYVYLAARGALRGIDPSLEEAARGLGYGPWRSFIACTLPQLRPAIGVGALLAALYAAADFSVVTLMRYDAFTRAIYTQYRAAFDRTFAAALSLLLVSFALTLLVAERRFSGKAAYFRVGSGPARAATPVKLKRWRWVAVGYCLLVALLALVVPVATLIYWLGSGRSAGRGAIDLPGATMNTILLASLSALAVMTVALPIALLAVRSRSWVSGAVERLTYLGYAMPGIVVGLAFVFFGTRYLTSIYQTLPLLIVAMVVRFLPQGVGTARASFLQINPNLEAAARSLGASPGRTLVRVTVPIAAPGLTAGALLVFLTVTRELPITLLLSPTGFDTLAVETWTAVGAGAYGKAAAPALLAILICAVPALVLSLRADRAFTTISQ